MFVASVIQHAKRIRRYCIVIFGLSGTTIFFSIYHPNGMNFERKKLQEHKICILIITTAFG